MKNGGISEDGLMADPLARRYAWHDGRPFTAEREIHPRTHHEAELPQLAGGPRWCATSPWSHSSYMADGAGFRTVPVVLTETFVVPKHSLEKRGWSNNAASASANRYWCICGARSGGKYLSANSW